MKPLTLLLLALLFQGCYPSAPKAEAIDCNLPSPSSDTAQIADFKKHLTGRNVQSPFIPNSDTMYCFRGHAGWGDFDYLCSVYNDDTGYKASFNHFALLPHQEGNTYWEQTKPISRLTWEQVQSEFYAQAFWRKPYIHDRICTDADEYFVWGREGNKFRLINWQSNCVNGFDSLTILGKNLLDLCSGAAPTAAATYSIRHDSIHAVIYSTNYESGVFIKEKDTEIHYAGKLLSQKEGVGLLVLPIRNIDSLKKVEITEYIIDGSVRRFRVTETHQEKD